MLRSWLRRSSTHDASASGQQPCTDAEAHPGECNICGSQSGFCFTETLHSRDNFTCRSCNSSARDRLLIKTLGDCIGLDAPLDQWPAQPMTLLETSGYRATPPRLAKKFRYINLMYESTVENGMRGDLSHLGLRDESLDVLLTADVFEHVREDEPAWREVYRVLKPGGYLILQAPAIGEFETTQVRVEVRGGKDVYLMDPEYHAENTLVYRNYGADVLDRLSSLGFAVIHRRGANARHCIREQSIVIAQKAPHLTLGPREISERAWS